MLLIDILVEFLFLAFHTLKWFVGAGIVAVFILRFKPTRKIIKKFLPILLTKE